MLITPAHIRTYRPIAANLDDEKRLAMYITEAEHLYIIPAIGAHLYHSIVNNPADYEALLGGGYYDDNKRHFAGLRAAIAMFSYARFVRNQNITVTPFGVKEKLSLDSNSIDERTLVRHANEAEAIANEYLRQCLAYLQFTDKPCTPYAKSRKAKYKAVGR